MIGLTLAAATAAAQVTVGSSGVSYATFSEAVAVAIPGDTLTAAPGTYPETFRVERDLVIIGAGVTVDGTGGTTAVIDVAAGIALTLTGARIESDTCRGIDLPGSNTLVLQDVVLATHAATEGGGVRAVEPRSLTLTDVVFDGTSALDGGGLHVSATSMPPVTLTDVTFERSRATGYYYTGQGGGLYAAGARLSCTRCRFDGGSAYAGGGATGADGSELSFTETVFHQNTSTFFGGALVTFGGAALDLVRTSVCGNSSGVVAGAVFLGGAAGPLEILNSAFIANEDELGGTVYANEGSVTIQNAVFAGHRGPGVVLVENAATATVVNSVVVDSGGFGVMAVAPATATFDHGLVHDNLGGDFVGVGTANVVIADPGFVAWTDDGDCANDVLLPGVSSPMVDAGSPALLDADGSVSDVGVGGGPEGDPAPWIDGDGDGVSGLYDCDDADAGSRPGATETCDGRDNDCDREVDEDAVDLTTWYEDCDGDGQGDLATAMTSCDPPMSTCGGAWVLGGAFDCDDTDPQVFVGADERCATGDQNCDGDPDLGANDTRAWFHDADDDGFGADDPRVAACDPPPRHVLVAGDCDDTRADAHPGAIELLGDGRDQDCDGLDNDLRPAGACSGCSGDLGSPGAGVLVIVALLARRRAES